MPTLEEKRNYLAQYVRSQMLRPGYELMARVAPKRFRVVDAIMFMLARLGILAETTPALSNIVTDAMWAHVSPYLQRPAPVLLHRINLTRWSQGMVLLENGSFLACVDATIVHPDGGFYLDPSAVVPLNLTPESVKASPYDKMSVLHWLGIIGGVHSGAGHTPDAASVSLWANHGSIHAGEQTTLRWVSLGAARLELNNDIGPVIPRSYGSIEVSPTVDTTYQATATGPEGTIPAVATAKVTIKTVPDAPVLTITGEGPLSDLSWLKPLGPVTGYRLEQSFDGVSNWFSVGGPFGPDELTFNVASAPGLTLHFRVIALGGTGESDPSNIESVTAAE